jgi:hypothetical protein
MSKVSSRRAVSLRKNETERTHDLSDGLGDVRTVDGDWQKVDNAPLVTGDVEVLHRFGIIGDGKIDQSNGLVLRVKIRD